MERKKDMGNRDKCQRCGNITLAVTMILFNTEMCCSECITKEKAHPKYYKASIAELKAIQNGDYNFPGIGLPDDL